MLKINKIKAERLYNEGSTIYLVPCKVYPDFNSPWVKPFPIDLKKVKTEYEGYPDLIELHGNFKSRINNFEYYNCNSELGNYTHFYIEE